MIVAFVLSLLSCHKNDEITGVDRAKALLGQWEYAAITTDRAVDINGDGIVNIDLYNTQEIRQCLKDNLTFFTERGVGEKGSYSLNENSLPCSEDTEFSNVEQDNYELVNNNTVISFDVRNEMRIVKMTQNKLVVDTDDVLGGESVIVTITFIK
ncbi:hypothetical protein NYZ99_15445 [Maribacter litopenaei]|uniref:Lipocalin-like domain-containing protein n=1 Tax=Maribacter litopenaei TaxID=2976127 RepID=A0ABY5Y7J6_9FLAO|nr:hypothetical protein [Maribacter litopenaei]UWX54332.1 hypothetical protein NYZ99_15445 [Maribacter litopenaei]